MRWVHFIFQFYITVPSDNVPFQFYHIFLVIPLQLGFSCRIEAVANQCLEYALIPLMFRHVSVVVDLVLVTMRSQEFPVIRSWGNPFLQSTQLNALSQIKCEEIIGCAIRSGWMVAVFFISKKQE